MTQNRDSGGRYRVAGLLPILDPIEEHCDNVDGPEEGHNSRMDAFNSWGLSIARRKKCIQLRLPRGRLSDSKSSVGSKRIVPFFIEHCRSPASLCGEVEVCWIVICIIARDLDRPVDIVGQKISEACLLLICIRAQDSWKILLPLKNVFARQEYVGF